MGPAERGSSHANRSPVYQDCRRQSLQADSCWSISCWESAAARCSPSRAVLSAGWGVCSTLGQHCPPGTATFQVRLRGREKQGTHIWESWARLVPTPSSWGLHCASHPEGGWLSRVVLSSKGRTKASSESSNLKFWLKDMAGICYCVRMSSDIREISSER